MVSHDVNEFWKKLLSLTPQMCDRGRYYNVSRTEKISYETKSIYWNLISCKGHRRCRWRFYFRSLERSIGINLKELICSSLQASEKAK